MQELHHCGNEHYPLYFTRFTPENDDCLRGKFSTKWEPRFSVIVNTWKYDKDKTYVYRAGWTEDAQQDQIAYKIVYPPQPALLNNVPVQVPSAASALLKLRYGANWEENKLKAPSYYRPDLSWGSDEMRKIKNK